MYLSHLSHSFLFLPKIYRIGMACKNIFSNFTSILSMMQSKNLGAWPHIPYKEMLWNMSSPLIVGTIKINTSRNSMNIHLVYSRKRDMNKRLNYSWPLATYFVYIQVIKYFLISCTETEKWETFVKLQS